MEKLSEFSVLTEIELDRVAGGMIIEGQSSNVVDRRGCGPASINPGSGDPGNGYSSCNNPRQYN